MLSIFKRGLQEPYRVVVDDRFDIVDLDSMINHLMLWERNFQLRRGHLPQSRQISSNVNVSKVTCSDCGRVGHEKDTHPELRPPRCDSCKKFHRGPCNPEVNGKVPQPPQITFNNGQYEVKQSSKVCCLKSSEPWALAVPHLDCECLLDTGATTSMMSLNKSIELLNRIDLKCKLSTLKRPVRIESGNKQSIASSQTITVDKIVNDSSVTFMIVPELSVEMLLGLDDIVKYDLLKLNRTIENSDCRLRDNESVSFAGRFPVPNLLTVKAHQPLSKRRRGRIKLMSYNHDKGRGALS